MYGDVTTIIVGKIIQRKERNSQFIVKHTFKCKKCGSINKSELTEVCAFVHDGHIIYTK